MEVNVQDRTEINILHEQLEDSGEKIKKEAGHETEFEDETEKLQAGDGKRGSNASQSSGCCMDPAFLQHFRTMEADQAKQQMALFHPM